MDVFGLVKLPSGDLAKRPTEVMIDRVSVTFLGEDMNVGVPAMWRFEDDGNGVCARGCSQCKGLRFLLSQTIVFKGKT